MVKTTVYIELETALANRLLAVSQRRTQAELIRDTLSAYTLDRPIGPKLPGMGEFDSGQSDTSEQAEEISGDAASSGRRR